VKPLRAACDDGVSCREATCGIDSADMVTSVAAKPALTPASHRRRRTRPEIGGGWHREARDRQDVGLTGRDGRPGERWRGCSHDEPLPPPLRRRESAAGWLAARWLLPPVPGPVRARGATGAVATVRSARAPHGT
jgi:hypothetical protein